MNQDVQRSHPSTSGAIAAALIQEANAWERRIVPTTPPTIFASRTSCIWEAFDRELAARALERGRPVREVARTLAARHLLRQHGPSRVREAAWRAWPTMAGT